MSEQISSQCEQCRQRYNLLRRKKQCYLCGQIFCSKCVPKSSLNSLNNSRVCHICLIIIDDRTTRDQLTLIRIKHLRAYLIHSKIISINRLELYIEKQDLVNLIEERKRPRTFQYHTFIQSPNIETINTNNYQQIPQTIINETEQVSSLNNTSSIPLNESRTEIPVDSSPPPPPPPPLPTKRQLDRIALGDISSLESIHDLTIRQLKDILVQNFVSTKGCVEKSDLINKVELLYRDQQQKESSTNISTEQTNENLCKICMDANIDCVFLDCGHLCTCIQCGKRLSECPLCRSYIIRVVRVFKS